MKKKIFLFTTIALLINSLLLPAATFAGDSLSEATFSVSQNLKLDQGQQDTGYFDDKENSPIVSFILRILNYATGIIGSIAIILFIIAGFRFMAADGNDQQLTEAKDMVKYAVIGLIATFASYVIILFVQSIFIPNQ